MIKRKRSLSLQRARIVKRFRIRYKYKGIKDESPQESYQKIFQLKFNRFIIIAVRKESLRKCVIVKRFLESDFQEELRIIYSIWYDYIIIVLEIFRFKSLFYVVLERIAIFLIQIVISPFYLGKQKLAAILRQIYRIDIKLRSIY